MMFLKDPRMRERPDIAAKRRGRFAGLNQFVSERGGWITSSPGEVEAVLEVLEGSDLPDLIRGGLKIDGSLIGRDLAEIKGCERILLNGAIAKTRRFSFLMP